MYRTIITRLYVSTYVHPCVMTLHYTQDYSFSGLCPSSNVPKTTQYFEDWICFHSQVKGLLEHYLEMFNIRTEMKRNRDISVSIVTS